MLPYYYYILLRQYLFNLNPSVRVIFYISISIYIISHLIIPWLNPKLLQKPSQPTWSSEFPTWLHTSLFLFHYSEASLVSSPIFLTPGFTVCSSLLLWTPLPKYRRGWSKLTSQVSSSQRQSPTAPSWDDSCSFSMASFVQCLHCLMPPWSITSMISNCRTVIPVPLWQEFTLSGSMINYYNQYRAVTQRLCAESMN